MALAVVVLADERGERTLDRGEDLGEVDLLGRAGEHVAAADAALRPHEPGPLHREQDLLEVGLREVRALGDLLDRRRAGRRRAARARAARGRRSRRASRPSPDPPRHGAMLAHCIRVAVTHPTDTLVGCSAASGQVEAVRPAYGGAALTSVIPTLVGGQPAPDSASWLPAALTGATAVVLLVLDGLGWNALETHRAGTCPAWGRWRAARSRRSSPRPRRPR